MIHITDDLFIDESELTFSATRSSGPGGQHVNKVSTRITCGLMWASQAASIRTRKSGYCPA